MTDWDSMLRVVTQVHSQAFQTLDRVFQTLGRAFNFLLRRQKVRRVLEKLDQAFGRLGRVF